MYREEPASPRRPFLVTAVQNRIFAVDRATGAIRWTVQLGGKGAFKSIVELAIDDDVVIACTTKYIGFIEYATGRVIRELELDSGRKMSSRPTVLVDGKQLFVTGYGSVTCYSFVGDLLWEQPFDDDDEGPTSIGFPGLVRQADAQ